MIGINFLYDLHPARKYFELLYFEHSVNRKFHNNFTKDLKKSVKYSKEKAGVNKNNLHSSEWIVANISYWFSDLSLHALFEPLVNMMGLDRKPVLPSRIDLEYTQIPPLTFGICNSPTIRRYIDLLMLGGWSDDEIAKSVSELDGVKEMDPDPIKRYRYFFFNIDTSYAAFGKRRLLGFMEDIAKIDQLFEKQYSSHISLLSGEDELSAVLGELGFKIGYVSHERRRMKRVISRVIRDVENLSSGGNSDNFSTLEEGGNFLRKTVDTYASLDKVIESEPPIKDMIIKEPNRSTKLHKLSHGEILEIYYDRTDGELTRDEVQLGRGHEMKKVAEGGDFEDKSIKGEINGNGEDLEPKGKGKKDSGKPPKPTGPRKG